MTLAGAAVAAPPPAAGTTGVVVAPPAKTGVALAGRGVPLTGPGLPAGVAAPLAAAPKKQCAVTDPRLRELSGLVVTKNGYIVINDSTDQEDRKQVFYLNKDCAVTNAVPYSGGGPLDTEDLALSPDGKTLWIADTGDNVTSRQRRERVAVWSMPVNGSKQPTLHRMSYPDGKPRDAEALLIGDDNLPLIITKVTAGKAEIFTPDGRLKSGDTEPVPMKKLGDIELPKTDTENPLSTFGRVAITGAARSPDGSRVALRTYADAFEYDVANGDIVAALTTTTPRVTALDDPFGEAIAYSTDGKTFLTVSDAGHLEDDDPVDILSYTPSSEGPKNLAEDPDAAKKSAGQSFIDGLTLDDITYLIAAVGVLGTLLVGAGILGIVLARKRPAPPSKDRDGDGPGPKGKDDGSGPAPDRPRAAGCTAARRARTSTAARPTASGPRPARVRSTAGGPVPAVPAPAQLRAAASTAVVAVPPRVLPAAVADLPKAFPGTVDDPATAGQPAVGSTAEAVPAAGAPSRPAVTVRNRLGAPGRSRRAVAARNRLAGAGPSRPGAVVAPSSPISGAGARVATARTTPSRTVSSHTATTATTATGTDPGVGTGRAGRSDAAQHGDDPTHDGGVVAGNRIEGRVLRHQPDMAVPPAVGLHGRLAVEHGGDDLAGVRGRLLPDHHPVAVADRRVEHRVALDLEHEDLALADQLPGQRKDVLHRLLGEDRPTGGDPTEHRHVRRGGSLGAGQLVVDVAGRADVHGPWTVRVAPQEALLLQLLELVGDAGRRDQPHRLTDLADARRVTVPLHPGADEVEDAPLPGGQVDRRRVGEGAGHRRHRTQGGLPGPRAGGATTAGGRRARLGALLRALWPGGPVLGHVRPPWSALRCLGGSWCVRRWCGRRSTMVTSGCS
ncbi:hypothetical protein Jiend_12110 [Micromonospora endophytica]|nr:hypothetical protein Jiend_12110 [Micromonospora endophytica]